MTPTTDCESPLPEAMVERLREHTEEMAPWLSQTRRAFHKRPEVGWREIETTRTIAAELESLGYRVTAGREFLKTAERLNMSDDPIPGEGDTGCIAEFDTGRPGPIVCLRVDIDALPIEEARGNHAPNAGGWRSEHPGVMHACGHDGHITIGLGVARLLRPLLDELPGGVKLIFQPAEEGGRGARAVLQAGWVDDVDFLTAVHVGLGVPSRTLAVGVHGFLATRKYRVSLKGRPAHAGVKPEEGRNALIGACQMVLGLHALAQSSRPGVRLNVGTMAAGKSLNIVPEFAVFDFEMRAVDGEDLGALERRCLRLIDATAEAHELGREYRLLGEVGPWKNPPGTSDWALGINSLTRAFPDVRTSFNFGGGEDVTSLAARVVERGGEAAVYVVGADIADGHHTPHFDFDEDVLPRSVLFLAAGLVDRLLAQERAAR